MARREFEPTAADRRSVELMSGLGIPEAEITYVIINPETGKPISENTLRKHFKAEIAKGGAGLKTQVGQFVVNTILGRTRKVIEIRDGKEVEVEVPLGLTSEQARATLTIFFCKTRMGWKETSVHEHANSDGKPFIFQVNQTDAKL